MRRRKGDETRYRVAIVGGGWSGIAAALELQAGPRCHNRGLALALFEAAPGLGGRARTLHIELGGSGFDLDSGQHLLLGAYHHTLGLIHRLGVDPDAAFLSLPFEWRFADGAGLQAARTPVPAPWHLVPALLGAASFGPGARRRLLAWLARQTLAGWSAPQNRRVADLFPGGAADPIVRWVWRPLCLAALNLAPERASARIFLRVLRDSLGSDAGASRMLIPRHPLSALIPEPAAARLCAGGMDMHLRTLVTGMQREGLSWTLAGRDGSLGRFDAVILALPPLRAASLLAGAREPALTAAAATLAGIEPAPITTAYLRFAPQIGLARPLRALYDRPEAGEPAQVVFDHGHLDPARAGVMAAVISGEGPHLAMAREDLLARVTAQVRAALALPAPLAGWLHIDRRATVAPVAGLRRPPSRLPAPGLFLAGDAADSPYPSTLEGSVRSGIEAAQAARALFRS